MSQYIHRDNLVIPTDRQREHIPADHLKDLKSSIQSLCLIHPIVLRQDGRTLCAGECRTAAMLALHDEGVTFQFGGEPVPKDMLPFTTLGELTEDQVYEIELEENLKRRDLSVADKAAAIAKLHTLRQKQAEERGEKWTATNTAREVFGLQVVRANAAHTEINENLVIAEHLHLPEVKKAKTKKEALKVVTQLKEKEHRAKLAEAFKIELENLPSPHTLIQGDTREEIRKLAPGSYDVIITDPPYGVGADEFGTQSDARHEYADTKDYALEMYTLVARYGKALTKPDAHLYAFLDIRYFAEIRAIFLAEGWEVWTRPLIWFKGDGVGMLPNPTGGPRNTYEAILYATKGNLTVNHVASDVITTRGFSKPKFGAEKPWELYYDLLARSVRPGFAVLDMFAGAGPVIPAASKLHCKATAIELNPDKYNYMLTRLKEEPSPIPSIFGGGNG